MEPRFEQVDKDDDAALRMVVSLNMHRRHLSIAQRAAIAAELENLQQGQKRANTPNGMSRADAAALVGVSERSVARAAKLKRKDPEAHEAVKRGEATTRLKPKPPQKYERGEPKLIPVPELQVIMNVTKPDIGAPTYKFQQVREKLSDLIKEMSAEEFYMLIQTMVAYKGGSVTWKLQKPDDHGSGHGCRIATRTENARGRPATAQ